MKDNHKLFAAEYLKNGRKPTEAYLKIAPHVTRESAKELGNKLLSRLDVRTLLDNQLDKHLQSALHSKDQLLTDAQRIGTKAEQAKKYQTALSSIDLRAKLTGAYRDGDDVPVNMMAFKQEITINMNKEEPETLEAELSE